jgi:membrane protein DedA with SNARE-associated domain
MSADVITSLILQYKYWILVPLTFIEGPIVAFVAGTLAAVGLFNIYWLALLFFVRDMGLDALYYGVGYWGGKSRFALRMLKRIGITSDHLGNVRRVWEKRPFVTMFIGKLAYGIATAFIIAAGTVRLPLRYFFGYGFIVAILQYGLLLVAGYYLGASFGGQAEKIISNIGFAAGIAALLVTVYYLVSWRIRATFLKKDEEIEREPALPS